MTVIEIPDDCAAALTNKAAEEGLSLEQWLRKLAGECESPKAQMTPQQAIERIREFRRHLKPDLDGLTIRDYLERDRE